MFKRSAGLVGRSDSPATRKRQKTDGDGILDEGRRLLAAIDTLTERRTGRVIATEFQRLPSRKLYPDYYVLIKRPVALDGVRRNLEDGEYVTLDLMREDLLQMCSNAKRYNQKGSQLYSDAAQIAKLVKNWSGDPENYSEDSDLEEISRDMSAKNYRTMLNQTIKGIVRELKEAKDRNGRKYIDIFLELPDKKLYPDYYTMITNPMSVRTMEVRMKKNPYTKLDKFHEHINQLYQNAFIYNDPKSQVAMDAKHLQKLTDKLIEEARPEIERQERELAEQAKSYAKQEARTTRPSARAGESSVSSGGFKIKLGLRQPSATPSQTPIPKVKLNLGSSRPTLPGAQPSPVGTPVPRKSTTPVPVQAQVAAKSTPAVSPPAVSSPAPVPAPTPAPPLAPAEPLVDPRLAAPTASSAVPTLPPTNVFETPIVYANSGTPLILFLSLCGSQVQPPMILHIPAIAGQASLLYSWVLPISASAMTVSPSLCQTLLEGKRGYAVTMALNGRKTAATRQSGGQTPIKNSIWDFKLSSGMNCIECIVEAEASVKEPPAAAVVPKQEEKKENEGVKQETSENTVAADKPKLTDGKDRERMVVLVYLR